MSIVGIRHQYIFYFIDEYITLLFLIKIIVASPNRLFYGSLVRFLNIHAKRQWFVMLFYLCMLFWHNESPCGSQIYFSRSPSDVPTLSHILILQILQNIEIPLSLHSQHVVEYSMFSALQLICIGLKSTCFELQTMILYLLQVLSNFRQLFKQLPIGWSFYN